MERNARLATGLTLFAYAFSHFSSHATGLFGVATMDAIGRNLLLAPWQTWAGRCALFGSLLIHASLGLRALYRRRHLRIPAAEAAQLGIGLLIPVLLIPHATNVRLGHGMFGLDESYYRILYQYWITPPWLGFARQLCLLFAVWVHGCVGLHFWLRTKPWYAGARAWLLAGAVAVPFLAILGLVNGGWGMAMTAALQPDFAAAHGPAPPGSDRALAFDFLKALWWQLQLLYVAIVVLVLILRLGRNVRAHRRSAVRITYPDGRVVSVPVGFSILEASRWAGLPHASICGGRGRCSTCRIWVGKGLENLAEAAPVEATTLRRVRAGPGVRLACQVRPTGDISVTPLLPAGSPSPGLRIAEEGGRELLVTALYIDMRESTRMAAGRLPFDALFIVDRYVQRVTGAVQANGGHITSIAGDGIMTLFGASSNARAGGSAEALNAAADIWEGLDRLSEELASELDGPLTFGIGLHSGFAAVGSIQVAGRMSLQFLGDTGNVAARLEAMTKDLDCTVIISTAVFEAAGRQPPTALPRTELRIRGREEAPVSVALLRARSDVPLLRASRLAVAR